MSILRITLLLFGLLSFNKQGITQVSDQSATPFSVLDSLIEDCYLQGNINQALSYAEQAFQQARKTFGKKDSIYAAYLGTYAYFLSQNGLYDEAEPLLREELGILANNVGHKHPDYAMSLNNLAALYIRTEKLEAAEPLLLESLKIWYELVGKEHPYYTIALNNLAAVYDDLKRYEESEKLYYEVLELRRRSVGTKDPLYAAALNNLAFNYSLQNNYREAVSLHQEVLSLLKSAKQEKHAEFAAAMLNLAFCYQKTGQNGEAEKLYLDALALKERVLGKSHPSYLSTLNLLTDLYLHTLRRDEAAATIRKALSINLGNVSLKEIKDPLFFEKLPTFRHYNEAFVSLQKLMDLFTAMYQQSGDINILHQQQRAVNFALNTLDQYLHEFNSEQDRIKISAMAMSINEKGLQSLWTLKQKSNAPNSAQIAFLLFERAKSTTMLRVLQSKAAKQFGELPPALLQQMSSLRQKQAQLQAAMLNGEHNNQKATDSNLLAQYNSSIHELDALRTKIEKDYPKYYQLQYRVQKPDLKKIQAKLSPQKAIIEYFITDKSAMALCITQSTIQWYDLKNLDKANITQFRQAASDFNFAKNNPEKAFNNFQSTAFSLYQSILEPILEDLSPTINALVIIPDHQLQVIPFEILLTKVLRQENQYKALPYLMLDYEISYDYSAQVWLEKSKLELYKNGQMLGMAATYQSPNNDLVLRAADLQQQRASLQDLPAARAEVLAMSKRFKGQFYLDEEASEKNFKAAMANYGIIHLALHSLMDNKYPVLSGLLFSEDGESAQNNILQSYEISQMELHANLVVLSACETGYGNLQQGEGVLSLGSAFMYAGVPSMVVSLWQINDESTAILMEKFYTHLANGENKAAALQKAKITYLKAAKEFSAHPAFWAALVQWGDSRPIPLEQVKTTYTNNWDYRYIGLLLLASFAIIFVLWKLNTL